MFLGPNIQKSDLRKQTTGTVFVARDMIQIIVLIANIFHG